MRRKSHYFQARKRKRAKKLAKSLYIFLPLFLVIGGLLMYGAITPQFRINTVTLTGLDRIEEKEVRAFLDRLFKERAFYIFPRDIIWTSKHGLASALEAYSPVIRNISIDRDWPNELIVNVVEYSEWGVVCQGLPEECYWIDRAGVAFEEAPDFSGTIVPKITDNRDREIELGEKQLSQRMMRLITFFNERAKDNDHLQSLSFSIDKEDQTLRAETRAGWEILLLDDTDPIEAYRNMQLSLEKEIGGRVNELDYIDLRFGNRIFYRFIEYDR